MNGRFPRSASSIGRRGPRPEGQLQLQTDTSSRSRSGGRKRRESWGGAFARGDRGADPGCYGQSKQDSVRRLGGSIFTGWSLINRSPCRGCVGGDRDIQLSVATSASRLSIDHARNAAGGGIGHFCKRTHQGLF